MLGIIYLILNIISGYCFINLCFPKLFDMTEKSYTGKKIKFPSLYFIFPLSIVIGTLCMTWPTYILACVFNKKNSPLSIANSIVLCLFLIFVTVTIIFKYRTLYDNLKKSVKGFKIADGVFLLLVTILVSYLMFLTFFVRDNCLCVGYSVFSDFSPHLGMIRSFSRGNNFPTSYSHFAGEDIKYHFMFQFLVGNLEYLGLRLDLAFNLPSIICLVSVCMLLYVLGVKLFAKRAIAILGVVFFLFRSGSALTTYISEINGKAKDIIRVLSENVNFIGKTLHEDWGLWNLNVYANQRHLAFGLCILLCGIIIMLPLLFEQAHRIRALISKKYGKEDVNSFRLLKTVDYFKSMFFEKKAWLPASKGTLLLSVFLGCMLGLGAFFNGACIIACLLVMLFLAIISDRRLEYLIVAVIAVAFSFIQSSVFIDGSAMEFRWEPGFLANVPTFFGTCDYLLDLLGILPFVLIAVFLMVNGYHKWILFAFIMPIVFAVTFQMTPDVAVNHKYIMIGCMLADVFAGAFIYKLWNNKGLMTKVVAILAVVLLTCTGLYDLYTVAKKNSHKNGVYAAFAFDDPVTAWVSENSDSKDIYLTDWYALNDVVLGGAMLYYGWPYYAWSAGYDTEYRELQTKEMLSSESSDELIKLCEKNNIRYIIVDYNLRTNPNYYVREDIIYRTYEKVFSYDEGEWEICIYDTKKVLK